MINDSTVVFKGEVLTNVLVTITRPSRQRPMSSSIPRPGPSPVVKLSHGTIRLTNKATGVFETLDMIVTLKEDAGGPIDEKWFFIALSKELLLNEETRGSLVSFEHFVGFDYIQGFDGKFLGPYNERFRITDLRQELSREMNGYDLQIKGLMLDSREARPFFASMVLESSLSGGDMVDALVGSDVIKDRLDVALRQELNKRLPSVDLIESISMGSTGMPLVTITYLNTEFYARNGMVLGDAPHGNDMEVWIHPKLSQY